MNKVDLYCAALYRQGFVIQTINSLKDQPEFGTCTVVCNNHTDDQWQEMLDTFSGDTRIKFHRHNNEKASNEKLRYIDQGNSPYICLFDNDLLYPPDFLHKLISGCEKYAAHVSLHGVILAPRPIRSYYRNRQVFRGLKEVIGDHQVDLASNCGSLFKREWFGDLEDWYDKVGNVSADDIYVGIFMKQRGIPRYVLGHPEDYIKHKEQLPGENYVFDQYALVEGADSFQTMLINSFYGN